MGAGVRGSNSRRIRWSVGSLEICSLGTYSLACELSVRALLMTGGRKNLVQKQRKPMDKYQDVRSISLK